MEETVVYCSKFMRGFPRTSDRKKLQKLALNIFILIHFDVQVCVFSFKSVGNSNPRQKKI